jgi:hypothetical protein
MDAKKKQMEGEEFRDSFREPSRERYREERSEASEFDVPEEVESWALDDLSDLVPTTFD